MPRIDFAWFKRRLLRFVEALVLQQQDLPRLTPAENAHQQVEIAVAVEVTGLNIRDATQSLQ